MSGDKCAQCEICGGTGEGDADIDECDSCDGSGWVCRYCDKPFDPRHHECAWYDLIPVIERLEAENASLATENARLAVKLGGLRGRSQ